MTIFPLPWSTCISDNNLVIEAQCIPLPPATSLTRSRRSLEQAQSTVEFVGVLPLLAFAALACLQALLVAFTLVLAQHSVDRAAQPGATRATVARSLPPAWRSTLALHRTKHSVGLSLRAPAVLPGAGRLLRIRVTAPEVQS
ncbi:MAG: hypothetical protein H7287_13140 [Thermoleophilia bacterium]|nr:hypothetical protein [Thermoleophilia bacterium]